MSNASQKPGGAWIEELMQRWLEGTLSPAESALLKASLAEHPEQRALLQRMAAVEAALRAQPKAAPSPQFSARVMLAIRALPCPRRALNMRSAIGALVALSGSTVLVWASVLLLLAVALAPLHPVTQILLSLVSTALGVAIQLLSALLTTARALLAQPAVQSIFLVGFGATALWLMVLRRQLSRLSGAT